MDYVQFAHILVTTGNHVLCGTKIWLGVSGVCVVVFAFVAMGKVLALMFCKMLEDPGPELSSCNFHALGSNYGSLAAAGTLWLPLKRLTLFSIPL